VMASKAKQTAGKYVQRDSPPYKAGAYPNKRKKGNDGKFYVSLETAGSYKWYLATSKFVKSKEGKGKKSRKSKKSRKGKRSRKSKKSRGKGKKSRKSKKSKGKGKRSRGKAKGKTSASIKGKGLPKLKSTSSLATRVNIPKMGTDLSAKQRANMKKLFTKTLPKLRSLQIFAEEFVYSGGSTDDIWSTMAMLFEHNGIQPTQDTSYIMFAFPAPGGLIVPVTRKSILSGVDGFWVYFQHHILPHEYALVRSILAIDWKDDDIDWDMSPGMAIGIRV